MGHKGNMGLRYRTILDYLKVPWRGIDKDDHLDKSILTETDAVIIATPTHLHMSDIRRFSKTGIPILCEKPITKHLDVLELFAANYGSGDSPLQMVHQYDYLVDPSANGESYYDYFKHGSDGIYWDCIQIIGHAKGPVRITEKSPIWKCQINGKALSLADMDQAYVTMIERWLDEPEHDLDRAVTYHQKVNDLERRHGKAH